MRIAANRRLSALQQRVARFAEREIAGQADLHSGERFPLELWQKMADESLLGLNIPHSQGGVGLDHAAVLEIAETLVVYGHNMGLVFSMLIHLLVSYFMIFKFGKSDQRDRYLPKLAKGEITASLAISESGAGAHPKHLTTRAECRNGAYLLNGRKSYVSNGPIADLFIVFAITERCGERSRFTAFLIFRDCKGLTVGEPFKMDFLRPSLHCEIELRDCLIHEAEILGEPGLAYEKIARPFREYEDVYLMGLVRGGLKRQMKLFVDSLQNRLQNIEESLKTDLGELHSLITSLGVIAAEAAKRVEDEAGTEELQSLLFAFKSLAAQQQAVFKSMLSTSGLHSSEELDRVTSDLAGVLNIGRSANLIKQRKLAENLIAER